MRKTALTLTLAGALAGASSAFASPPDERALWEALQASATKTDRMATKTDRMATKTDSTHGMGVHEKGMRSSEDLSKLLDPNIANP